MFDPYVVLTNCREERHVKIKPLLEQQRKLLSIKACFEKCFHHPTKLMVELSIHSLTKRCTSRTSSVPLLIGKGFQQAGLSLFVHTLFLLP